MSSQVELAARPRPQGELAAGPRPQGELAARPRPQDGSLGTQQQERDDGSLGTQEKERDAGPLFPLVDKETLKQYLVALSTAALVGITTINVLTSTQGQDPTAKGIKYPALRKFLVAMPYSVFPAGLAGLASAMVATTRRPRLLSCAAGFLLGQLVFLVLMGGLVSMVRADVQSKIVWPVTGGIVVLMLIIWRYMCAYPEFLRWCPARCVKTTAGDNARKSQMPCTACGAMTVNGRSPNPAAPGTKKCTSCGGAVGGPPAAPGDHNC